MEKKSDFDIKNKCYVRDVLDKFGDKWSILIILTLEREGTMRFNQLNRQIGDVSQKMLTVTLKSLQADGLVSRTVFPEIPPRVEYNLTELGMSLVPHIHSLANWAEQNMETVLRSRAKFAEAQ